MFYFKGNSRYEAAETCMRVASVRISVFNGEIIAALFLFDVHILAFIFLCGKWRNC